MTPAEFIKKWAKVSAKESAAYQSEVWRPIGDQELGRIGV